MDSLIFIITLIFLVAGIALRHGRRRRSRAAPTSINAITKTSPGLAGLIFMLLMITQFIAYFNYTQHADASLAVEMADVAGAGRTSVPLWLLIGFILVIAAARHHHPGRHAEVGDLRAGLHPAVPAAGRRAADVLAAYRVGDSPMNVVTPLMVYLPFIVIVAQRYQKDAGLGTIISLMIPYIVIIAGGLDAVLRRLVRAGHPARPGLPGPA